MKKIIAILLMLLSTQVGHAGFGKSFGGALLGTTIANTALSPITRPNTVVVREEENTRLRKRRRNRDISNLSNDIDTVFQLLNEFDERITEIEEHVDLNPKRKIRRRH